MPVERKSHLWIQKAIPGKHKKGEGIALGVLVREVLKLADSMREAKRLLNAGEILVDGLPAHESKSIVGLMDIISIPKIEKHYCILLLNGKLAVKEVSAAHAKWKIAKIINKKILGKSRIQLNLHDGRNYLIEKEEDRFSPGDSIKIAIPKQKLEGFFKLEKGALCYIAHGKHSGALAHLEKIEERAGSKESDAVLKTAHEELITVKSYLFVVDKEFSTQ